MRHNDHVRLDPDDELTELLDLDQAAQVAEVSRRTINRWIHAEILRVVEHPLLGGRYVLEGELLAVEKTQWQSRHAGWRGPRLRT